MDTDPEEDWTVLWAFAAVLVGFKLVGLAIILWIAAGPGLPDGAFEFLLLYHVPFLAAAVALAYWPARFWYRRLRARARRPRLIWSEWHVEEGRLAHRPDHVLNDDERDAA